MPAPVQPAHSSHRNVWPKPSHGHARLGINSAAHMSIPRLRVWLGPLLAFAALTVLAPGNNKVMAAPGPTITSLRTAGAREIRGVYVRPPQPRAPGDQPMQVLIALHGMGGNGLDFGSA